MRPLEWALGGIKVVLVPVLALAVALPVLIAFTGVLGERHKMWMAIVGAALVLSVCFALLQTESLVQLVDQLLAGARRRVALACNNDDSRKHHGEGRVACWLTPEIFRMPVFSYQQQADAVTALGNACVRPGTEARFWFVEGDSGCGKTRTALRLVQWLARDRELCQVSNRCFLYDFRGTNGAQDKLRDALNTPLHDDAIVLVDNFQLVRPDLLRQLTSQLLEGSTVERLLVFLTRPRDVWNLSSGSDVRLLSEAKGARRYIELTGPAAETVTRRVSDVDREVARLVRDLGEQARASGAQLHFAQVIAHHRRVPPEMVAILQLLTRRETKAAPQLIRTLGIVTALSLHRGRFVRGELWRALRAARDGSRPANLARALTAYRVFRRFHRIGLVTRTRQEGVRYHLHETVAELCIDRLSGIPAFHESLDVAGRTRLTGGGDDPLDAWLVAAELGAEEELATKFDAAIARGAYSRMVDCLKRAEARYPLPLRTQLQLAILLNRTGEFRASRGVLTDKLVRELGLPEDLLVMLVTSRIEATHDSAAEEGLEVLISHHKRLTSIIGTYWRAHMAAHRGRFDSDALLALGTEAFQIIDERSHWLVYSVARMHFDSLRHLYLEGRATTREVVSPLRQDLDLFLQDSGFATYEGLHLLYTKAHLVAHVLLPRVAIFRELVTPDDLTQAEITPDEAASVAGLARASERLYERTRLEFEQYGDREAKYLTADVMNARMIQDDANPEDVERSLAGYAALGESFRTIASYPHIYRLRWHILLYYRALLRDGTPTLADHHLREARARLQSIIELDRSVGNAYGLARAKVLALLMRAVGSPTDDDPAFDRVELDTLAREMAEARYGFELKLLRHLAARDRLTAEELRTIFRFYPFVHQ